MEFKSGTWVGFYVQLGCKHRTELQLEFQRGRVSGCGADKVGDFVLRGSCTAEDVYWTKTYLGAHDVFYRGFSDGKHGICGVWEILGPYGDRGGFHIWPLGEEAGEVTSEKAGESVDAISSHIVSPALPATAGFSRSSVQHAANKVHKEQDSDSLQPRIGRPELWAGFVNAAVEARGFAYGRSFGIYE